MREISLSKVTSEVKRLLMEACYHIPCNVLEVLKKAKEAEESELGKEIIGKIIENDELASRENLPICQDTGIVVCFLEIGSEVIFKGDIYEAINVGVREAYTEGYLRKSVVRHPLDRVNTKTNEPF